MLGQPDYSAIYPHVALRVVVGLCNRVGDPRLNCAFSGVSSPRLACYSGPRLPVGVMRRLRRLSVLQNTRHPDGLSCLIG